MIWFVSCVQYVNDVGFLTRVIGERVVNRNVCFFLLLHIGDSKK